MPIKVTDRVSNNNGLLVALPRVGYRCLLASAEQARCEYHGRAEHMN